MTKLQKTMKPPRGAGLVREVLQKRAGGPALLTAFDLGLMGLIVRYTLSAHETAEYLEETALAIRAAIREVQKGKVSSD